MNLKPRFDSPGPEINIEPPEFSDKIPFSNTDIDVLTGLPRFSEKLSVPKSDTYTGMIIGPDHPLFLDKNK